MTNIETNNKSIGDKGEIAKQVIDDFVEYCETHKTMRLARSGSRISKLAALYKAIVLTQRPVTISDKPHSFVIRIGSLNIEAKRLSNEQ